MTHDPRYQPPRQQWPPQQPQYPPLPPQYRPPRKGSTGRTVAIVLVSIFGAIVLVTVLIVVVALILATHHHGVPAGS